MDKKPRSPIVAERDDMIGRTTSDKRADQANSKTSATSSTWAVWAHEVAGVTDVFWFDRSGFFWLV